MASTAVVVRPRHEPQFGERHDVGVDAPHVALQRPGHGPDPGRRLLPIVSRVMV